jgi:alpha-tubulin suppressor-like RCC1 family protein
MSTSSGTRPSSRRALAGVVALALFAVLVLAGGPQPAANAATGPVVSIGSTTVVETASLVQGPVKVPITLSEAQASDVVVTWVVSGGSATGGSDYKAISKPKTTKIKTGKVRGFATVQVFGDTVVEGNETIGLTLTGVTGGSGVTLGVSTGAITIVDQSSAGPVVSVGATSAVEGDTPLVAAPARVPITLSQPVGVDVLVTWSVTGGTAAAGSDFKGITKPKTTKIKAGKTTAAAPITLYGDAVDEPDETVQITISGVAGATLSGSSTGAVTIVDDDDPVAPASNLFTWGYNDSGQLGDGTTTHDSVPALVDIGEPATWDDVSAGFSHTCALRDDGTVWCWGDNFWGQLGDGTTTNRAVPAQMGTDDDWRMVSAGGGHTCGVRDDNTAWCWGRNDSGQVGDDTTTEAHEPVQVPDDGVGWATVQAAKGGHTCGTKVNGTLWCWGLNNQGQLGNGTVVNSESPVQVGSDGGWATVSGGLYHTCATHEDFDEVDWALFCWGYNGFGQLGDGTATSRRVPTLTWFDAHDWSLLVSAGNYHTCAVKGSGTLWCWGYNDQGQLGDGTTTPRSAPTQVGTESTWDGVAAGGIHSCGVKEDFSLWCWGGNVWGSLGDGSFDDSLVPVQTSGTSNMLRVSAFLHTVALRAGA